MIEITKKQRRTNRSGFALSLAAVMVVVLSLVGFGILRLGLETRMMAARTTAEMSARAAADAGLTKATFEMNKNLSVKPWGFNNMASLGNRVLLGTNASYTYTIEEITNDSEYKITSIGQSGSVAKTVSAILVVQGAFDYPMFAQGYAIPKQPKPPKQNPPAPKPLKKGGKLEIKGYSVDSYSSDPSEAYSGTIQLRTNNNHERSVKLRENVVINGDIVVGPGGDPDKIIEMKEGAEITGDAYPATERQELLSVTLPGSLESLPTQTYEYNAGVPITSHTRYSSFIMPKDVNAVQEIIGNVEIYVVGDVKVEDGAQLIVTEGSSLTLYVGGEKFEVKKKSAGLINENNDPANLLIYGLDTCREVKIENENTGDFYGAVYAPFAKVEMKTNGDLYGAFVGWDVKLKKKKGGEDGTFYFDRSLRIDNLLATDPLATRFIVKRWYE